MDNVEGSFCGILREKKGFGLFFFFEKKDERKKRNENV